jgi:hypothetical protein
MYAFAKGDHFCDARIVHTIHFQLFAWVEKCLYGLYVVRHVADREQARRQATERWQNVVQLSRCEVFMQSKAFSVHHYATFIPLKT